MELVKIAEALRRRDFEAEVCATRADALARVKELAAGAKTLGTGGSATVKEIGAIDALVAAGLATFPHGAPEEQVADVYLLSANALLSDGRIVNVDGTCNRVSASLYGPKKVVYVIGRNKVVEGGVDDAIARIRAKACPPNARRLGRRTPCAATGKCADCSSPDRMCKAVVVFERKPTHLPVHVLLVDEDLGF